MSIIPLYEVWNYLKKPKFIPKSITDGNSRTIFVLRVLLLDFILILPLLFLFDFLSEQEIIALDNHSSQELLNTMSPLHMFIIGAFISPYFEELFFRAILRPSLLLREKKSHDFWATNFPYIFWFTVLLFGIAHLTNYNNLQEVLFWIPLLVLPQIIMGALCGYIRMLHGFWYGVLFHILHNAPLILLAIISNDLGTR